MEKKENEYILVEWKKKKLLFHFFFWFSSNLRQDDRIGIDIVTGRSDKFNFMNLLRFDRSCFAERRNEPRIRAVVASYIVALARHEWPRWASKRALYTAQSKVIRVFCTHQHIRRCLTRHRVVCEKVDWLQIGKLTSGDIQNHTEVPCQDRKNSNSS